MVRTSSPYKLLFGSGVISVVGFVCFVKLFGGAGEYYQPGTTTTYHPPATQDVAEARGALESAGFMDVADAPAAEIFMPAFTGNEPVAIGTRLSHTVVQAGYDTELHAAISIQAQKDAVIDRAPLHLALVIDRSGSMVGDKLVQAKEAARRIVDGLGPHDRLAIVTYSTEVTTEVGLKRLDEVARAQMHLAIDRIDAQGGTNISGGLEAGRDLLAHAEDARAISRVILVSDGQANHGVMDAPGLGRLASDSLERGTSITAMGVGLDYDEQVMHAIANAGAGNYYFIDDTAKIGEVFSSELASMKAAVARNAVLYLQFTPGITLDTVHGYRFEHTKTGIRIPLDSFTANERKDILVDLRTVARGKGRYDLFTTELRYEDVQLDKPIANVQPIWVRFGSEQELDISVARRIRQIETLDAFQKAMELYDAGDRFAAAERLERQQRENREFLDDNDIRDAAFERVGRELGDLAESLRKTERHTSEGKWIVKSKYNYANSAVQSELVF